MWEAYGVRLEPFASWPPRPDPESPFVPRDVVGVYLRPPDLLVAFVLGPAARTAVDGRSPRGERPDPPPAWLQLSDAGSSGSWPPDTTRARNLARFLGELDHALGPRRPMHLLAHLPELRSGTPLGHWRVRHPETRLEFAGSVAAWRGRLADRLHDVGVGSSARPAFGSRGELAAVLSSRLSNFEESAGPFEWVASARDVAVREGGFRLRYALSGTGHHGFKSVPAVPPVVAPVTRPDPRARDMARVVLRQSLSVERGERVTIASWSPTLDFANAFVLETRRLGAHPLLMYEDEPTYWAAAAELPASHLRWPGEHQRAAIERSNAFVSFFGPSDRERFHALPRPTMLKLSNYQDALYAAAAKVGARAVSIALGRASEASARMYGVDLESWRNELIESTLVGPRELRRRADPLLSRLRRGREIVVRHANGTDLTLRLRSRQFEVSDGRVPRASSRGGWNLVQLPAGVLTVPLAGDRAEGTYRANFTPAVGMSDTVGAASGGTWTFRDGRLARATYDQGQELFEASFERAGPGRDRVNALTIGLNPRIDRAPLLDDQAEGTLTLVLGAGDEVWAGPKSFWRAWLILRGADVRLDGTPILTRGRVLP